MGLVSTRVFYVATLLRLRGPHNLDGNGEVPCVCVCMLMQVPENEALNIQDHKYTLEDFVSSFVFLYILFFK